MHEPAPSLLGRLRFKQLVLLCGVANGKSFRTLADEMALSQPAVSKMARELESAMNAPVFDRRSDGVVLNAFGQSLVQPALLILGQLNRLSISAQRHNQRRNEVLRIGVPSFTGVSLLAKPFAQLARLYPEIQVKVVDTIASALFQKLKDGDIDYVVGSLPPNLSDADVQQIHVQILYPDEVRFIAHPATLNAGRIYTLADLTDSDWVLPSEDSLVRNSLRQTFTELQLPLPVPYLETSIVPLIGAVVAEQSGLVTALRADAAHYLSKRFGLSMLNVEPRLALPPVGIITLRDAPPTPAANCLFQLIRDSVSSLIHPG